MPQSDVSAVSSVRSPVPRRAADIEARGVLGPSTSIDDGIASAFRAGLARWLEAVPAASRAHNVDGVHQLRVALRRVRSLFALLKDFIPPRQRTVFETEIKWLVAALAPVRDLDVFRHDLLEPLLEETKIKGADALVGAIVRQRSVAQRRAHAALISARHRKLMHDMETWIEGRGWHEGRVSRGALAAPAHRVVRKLLDKKLRKILKDGKRIKKLPPKDLHNLRISMKKLRYGISFFKQALPPRSRKLAKTLARLQDALGHLNDGAVASGIAAHLAQSAKGAQQRDRIKAAGKSVVAHYKKTAADVWPDIAPQWKALKKFGSI